MRHWTYDAQTTTHYTSERGEHYWETEPYTENVDGQTVTRTRQVQRTAWLPVSGTVSRFFDDVLVPREHMAAGVMLSITAADPSDLGRAPALTASGLVPCPGRE